MRKFYSSLFALTILAAAPAVPLASIHASAATGDLSVFVMSDRIFAGAVPGDTVTFSMFYSWDGTEDAPDVSITADWDASLFVFQSASVAPSSSGAGNLAWNLGALRGSTYNTVEVKGVVPNNAEFGSVLTFSTAISGNVVDEDPENNQSEAEVSIEAPSPDLWLWTWGLFEELEAGLWFTAERGVPTTFNILYFNWSWYAADNVVLVDTLAEGLEFISAVPAPSSVDGQVLTWNLGRVEEFGNGEITIRARPDQTGSFQNIAYISTTTTEKDPNDNRSTFSFEVLELLPPRLLKPNITAGNSESPAIVGRNPEFSGMARAGATVTLYEGSEDGCIFDFSGCNATPIGSALVGEDRTWTITGALNETRDYYLYLRAEKDGEVSNPPFVFYEPYVVRIDSIIDKSGFDLAHFTFETENQTIQPNALGGSSGVTPDADWTLNIRQQAPDDIATNAELLQNHTLRLEIFDYEGQHTQEIAPTQVVNAGPAGKTASPDEHWDAWDFIYVQKGFGPGSRVEIWCLPVFYTDDGLPIVGLVYVKCHEMLIDPAGYVYDLDEAGSEYEWPSVPPEQSLITNATVTAMKRTGDDAWERWAAEESGQVNPQVTDESDADRINLPGYYAFYVPSGQYQVHATAEGFADYVSPILTVIDAPVFHNVGMRRTAEKTTAIEPPKPPEGRGTLPDAALLHQNYPNPFNPSTTITYALMTPSEITLTVHNLLGQEVARLVHDVQQPGMHHVRFDAGDLPSGVYFYRLKAGSSTAVKKMTLVR